jgi:hypothetical protein
MTLEAAVKTSLLENPKNGVAAPSNDNSASPNICPITGYPCEGDLSYLCKGYGCARKGGLSPWSDENL